MRNLSWFVGWAFCVIAMPAQAQLRTETLPLNLGLFGSSVEGVPFNVRADAHITTLTTSKDIQMHGTVHATFKDALGALHHIVRGLHNPEPCLSGEDTKPFTITSLRPEVVADGTGIDSAKIVVRGYVTHCRKDGIERLSIFSDRSDLEGDILVGLQATRDAIVLRARKPSFKVVGGVGNIFQRFTSKVQADVDKKSAAYVQKIDGKKLTTPWITQHFRPTLKILRLTIAGADLSLVVQVSGRIEGSSVANWTGYTPPKKKKPRAGEVRLQTPHNAVVRNNPM
jgi:hypothetical protein